MRWLLARHGESEANLLDVFTDRKKAYPLTTKGVEQAQALARRLVGRPIRRIWASPLLRATQTAAIVGATLGLAVESAEALRTYDCGILEGRSDEEAWRTLDEMIAAWTCGEWERRIEGGESLREIVARLGTFLDALVAQYGEEPGEGLLVGHGGLFRNTVPRLVPNMTPAWAAAHALDNVEVIELEQRPSGELTCVAWGAHKPPFESG